MTDRVNPRSDSYDAVVVGSGLGGVSTAAVLARAGLRVLVCERGDGPGGLAHAFRRGPYTIDPAVHFTLEAGGGQFLDVLLRHLDIRDLVDLVPLRHPYRLCMPGLSLRPPTGAEEFAEAHVAEFPGEAAGIRRFVDLVGRFSDEAARITMQLSLRNLDEAVERHPTFFRYRTATLADVLDEHIGAHPPKAALGALWTSFGLPPSRLSFYLYAQYLSLLTRGGAFYCRGGFQRLADAFVAAVERHGGEFVTRNPVERIVVRDGRVLGVDLPGGRVRAPLVVSNADARHTFDDLVGAEHLPDRFVRRLHRMEPSLSSFSLYAATTLDVAGADPVVETYIYRGLDHDAAYATICDGQPDGVFFSTPTAIDATLAPAGEHVLTVTSLAPYHRDRPWGEVKEEYALALLDVAEGVFPGLGGQLSFTEQATPLTLERFTGNYRGAAYGWAMRTDQVATKRLSHDTPIRGLFLSGHWTQEGSGSFRVMLSGVRTARLALEPVGLADGVPQL